MHLGKAGKGEEGPGGAAQSIIACNGPRVFEGASSRSAGILISRAGEGLAVQHTELAVSIGGRQTEGQGIQAREHSCVAAQLCDPFAGSRNRRYHDYAVARSQ